MGVGSPELVEMLQGVVSYQALSSSLFSVLLSGFYTFPDGAGLSPDI